MENIKNMRLQASIERNRDSIFGLAQKFIRANDGTELELSTFVTGVVGYFTEAFATVATDSALSKAVYDDERFLSTAKTARSIYRHCALHNFDISKAIPSRCKISTMFYLANLLEKINLGQNDFKVITISKDNIFTINNMEFMLPYDVKISLRTNAGELSVTTTYDFQQSNMDIGEEFIEDPTLINILTKEGVNDVLFINMDLFQVVKKSNAFIYSSNEYYNVASYEIAHEEQLAGFEAFYIDPETDEINKLEPVFGEVPVSDIDSSSMIIRYEYINENKIKFFLRKNGEFPKQNAQILINYFETRGSAGNFQTNDFAYLTINDPTLGDLRIINKVTSSPTGGIDRKQPLDIKTELMKKIQSNDLVVSDMDVENFISKYTNGINGSQKVVKTRDDVIKRSFTSYLLLRGPDNSVIPTLTNKIKLKGDNISGSFPHGLEENHFNIPAGSFFYYDKYTIGSDVGSFSSHSFTDMKISNTYPTLPGDLSEDFDKRYIYRNLFHINISDNPFPHLTYYNTATDKTLKLFNDQFNNSDNKKFFTNKLNIKRNVFSTTEGNKYFLRYNVLTDAKPYDELNSSNFQGKIFLYRINNNVKEYIGYVEALIEGTPTTAPIPMVGSFIASDAIENGLTTINILSLDGTPTDVEISEEEIYFDVVTFYKDGNDFMFSEENNTINEFEEDGSFFLSEEGISGWSSVVKAVSQPILLLKNSNNLMESSISTYDRIQYDVNNVALVGNEYISTEENFAYVMNLINNYEVVFERLLDKMENSDVNFKFYNTYGKSEKFTTATTDISISMTINVEGDFSDTLETEIEDMVISFMNQLNEKDEIATSNISTMLENEFPISSVSDIKINSQNVSSIRVNDGYIESIEQSNNQIPEFLNIGKDGDEYKINIKIEGETLWD